MYKMIYQTMHKTIAPLLSSLALSSLIILPVGAQVTTLEFNSETPQDSGQISAQGVEATLQYQKAKTDSDYTEYTPQLTVTAGDQRLQITGETAMSKYSRVQIADMDPSNPFPEVIFSSFTGGAHCCTAVKILTINPTNFQWQVVDAGAFDGGMDDVQDPTKTGIYKLIERDNRFLYLYSSYAGSFPPLQIWQLKGTKLVDVSKDPAFFPLHRQQLQEMWKAIEESSKNDYEVNGILAGYVATKAILGEGVSAWQLMLKRYDRKSPWGLQDCPSNYDDKGNCIGGEMTYKSFPEALRSFLVKAGYLQSDDLAQYPLL